MRITVPPAHTALILPNQLADEMMSLLKLIVINPRDVSHSNNRNHCQKIASDLIVQLTIAPISSINISTTN